MTSWKMAVFIQTQGQPNEKLFADIYPPTKPFLKRVGFPECYFIRACGVRKLAEVEGREQEMNLAEEMARKILSSWNPGKRGELHDRHKGEI